MEKLTKIQAELKVPKSNFNSFGKYNYRSCEDIMEAVKPVLKKHGCLLTVSDEVTEIGGRVYVKATAVISDGETQAHTTAFAREPDAKKGFDESQITGAASSYARKYALAGLFLLDDQKDADATNRHEAKAEKPTLKESTEAFQKAIDFLVETGEWERVEKKYVLTDDVKQSLSNAVTAKLTKTVKQDA